MCGRYLRRSDKQRIAEAFALHALPADYPLPPDFNVAPYTFQPVIRLNRQTHQRELVSMRWGLVPYYAESPADWKGTPTINAKAETLQQRSLWRAPLQKRRCLVPADGFYEWQKIDPRTRQPWAYTLTDGAPFAFAGLWDAWKDPVTGEWLQTFALITTTANKITAPVHDRMPVILAPRDYDRWLARGHLAEIPLDLLCPFDADRMQASRANNKLGNIRNNGPEMLHDRIEEENSSSKQNSL